MTLQRNNAAALLAATVSMALLAASCSSSDDDAGDKTTVTSTGANSSTDVAATDQDGATRTVTDSEGTEVEVPVHPQRAVTLHFAGTEALLDLGVTPVLQGAGDLESMLPPEEFAKVKDVPQVETGNDLNIEKVAQAKPDIILAADMVDKKIVEQLREFAPVYVYTHSKDRSNWQGRGDQIADAMNLNTKLDEVKAELAKRQSTIADTYRDTLSGIHAALPVSWKADSFTVVGPESMPGRILAPAGLQWDQTTTEMTKGIDGQELTQSTENVASTLKDANVIFYGTDLHGKASAETTAVMDLEAFKDLPAAKDKKVFPVGKQTIAGYLDAFNALNLLENALKELQK